MIQRVGRPRTGTMEDRHPGNDLELTANGNGRRRRYDERGCGLIVSSALCSSFSFVCGLTRVCQSSSYGATENWQHMSLGNTVSSNHTSYSLRLHGTGFNGSAPLGPGSISFPAALRAIGFGHGKANTGRHRSIRSDRPPRTEWKGPKGCRYYRS